MRKSLVNKVDFRSLFESSPGLFLVLTPDLKIVGVSEAYLKATMTKRDIIVGRGIFDVFPDNPNDPAATGVANLSASLNRVLKNKKPDAMAVQKYDIPRPEAEGGGFEERYWSPLNSPVFENGDVAYIIHRVEDVTEFMRLKKKRAEESRLAEELKTHAEEMETEIFLRAQQLQEANKKLREAESIKEDANKFLKSILENIPNMIFVKDAKELRFVQFNKAGEELLGVPREELIGKNDYDFFSKTQADFFTAKDRQVLKEGKLLDIPEESINTRVKGTRWLHTKKIPIYDEQGSPIYLLGISEDITERKKAEEQIKEGEEQIRTTINNAPNAVVIINELGNIVIWNPKAENVFGWKPEEVIGKPMHEVIMPVRYRELHLQGVKNFLATGEGPVLNRTMELSALRKGNIEFPVELSISSTLQNNRHVFIAFIRDITERKAAEEKILQLNKELAHSKDELEQKVLDRTVELQEANTGLKEVLERFEKSNRRLEEFAYMASHNLKAPLANLTSLVSMYGREKKNDFVFEKIHLTTNQLNTIVSDLTDLVALDTPVVDKKLIHFDELLRSIKVSIEIQLFTSDASIFSDFSNAPSITYPHSHLQSILLNLLTNALKYRSTERKPVIKIKTQKAGDFIILSVADNGIGIDLEKYKDKIFKAFKRLSHEQDGKGLGLYIVKRQVESLGGIIEAQSKSGEGTTFIVKLKDNPPS